MKPHQLRQNNAYPYYKLAFWSIRVLCWMDLKISYATEGDAKEDARTFGDGRYRVSEVGEHRRIDREPFTVT